MKVAQLCPTLCNHIDIDIEVAQSCLTLCDPMDCSLPGSSLHGILQAGVLEWVAISFSRGSSRPRDWTCVSCSSCIGRQVLYHYTTGEACTVAYVLEIFTCSQSPWFGQNLFPFVWNTFPPPQLPACSPESHSQSSAYDSNAPPLRLTPPTSLKLPSGWPLYCPKEALGVASLLPFSGIHRPSSSSCLMAVVCLPPDFSSFET